MKEQVCCFTGHREMEMPIGEVRRRIEEVISHLISKGVIYLGAGGALGFDTLAAEAVIEVRKHNPRVKLILVLPCKDQDKKWLPEDRAHYAYLKNQANKIVYMQEKYTPDCMHKRNRHLVDNSKYCIALLERMNGGTAYTFNYARDKGLSIYNLNDTNYLDPVPCELFL